MYGSTPPPRNFTHVEKFLLNETPADFIDLTLMLFDHRKKGLNCYDIIMTELKKDPGNTCK